MAPTTSIPPRIRFELRLHFIVFRSFHGLFPSCTRSLFPSFFFLHFPRMHPSGAPSSARPSVCGIDDQGILSSESSKICSIGRPKYLARRNARDKEGLYFPFSREITVWRETPTACARSSCRIPRSRRSLSNSFFSLSSPFSEKSSVLYFHRITPFRIHVKLILHLSKNSPFSGEKR